MLDYFINQKEKQKLDIVQTILLSIDGSSTEYLIKEFQIKKSTFQRYIKEIQNDLTKVFENEVSLIITPQKNLNILLNGDLTPDYIVPILKKNYMEQSSLYTILSALINTEYSTITEIANDLNFSEPTIYKYFSKIRNLLAPFEVDIDLNSNSNFSGNELGIRYFLYLTYWHLFNVISSNPFSSKFPSEFIDIDIIKKKLSINKNLSKTQESKLIFLSGISSYRITYFNKYITMNDEFSKDIELFYDEHSLYNKHVSNIPSSIIENESKLFSFLIRGIISDYDSYEEKKDIVLKFKDSDLPMSKIISHFLDSFFDTFSITYKEDSYIESYYLLIFSYIYFNHIGFNVDHYFSVPIEHNIKAFKAKKIYKEIKDDLNFLLKQFPLKKPLNNIEKDNFLSLLFIIYELNHPMKPINIYVNHTSNIANVVYIKKNLTNFFSHNLITFCDSPNKAEIIISSAPEGNFKLKQIFYFENIFNQDTWQSLLKFLTNYLYDRIFR